MLNPTSQTGANLDRTVDLNRLREREAGRKVLNGNSQVDPRTQRSERRIESSTQRRLARLYLSASEQPHFDNAETTSAARMLASMIQQMGGGERSYIKGSFIDFAI